MTMLWSCPLPVEAYSAAGSNGVVPRPRCRTCGRPMMFRTGYERRVRAGKVYDIWVKRAYCRTCGGPNHSHALLPSFCAVRRLDAVETIGPAVEEVASGRGTRSVAKAIGELFAYTTVRGWWRRHRERSAMLVGLLTVVAAEWKVVQPETFEVTPLRALDGLKAMAGPVSAVLGIGLWPAVSLVTEGHWLSKATGIPFPLQPERRFMVVMTASQDAQPP